MLHNTKGYPQYTGIYREKERKSMVQITLRCCTCGERKNVEVDRAPAFGFEFYKVIQDAGWYPVLDMNYDRTLCFCVEDCMKKQLTKAGTIRKRLISCPKEQ